MKIGLNLKIDVTKIDKSKLFKGQKGTYLDAQVFVDLNPDQYGNNGMITQALSKEERDAGNKGAILGNGKIFWTDGGNQPQAPQQQAPQGSAGNPATPPNDFNFDDDIPY